MITKPGDIFEVRIAEGKVAYAQALSEPEFAFYESLPINNLIPMFRIWVHKSAIKEWKKIGNEAISREMESEIPRFKQDPINGNLSIYINNNDQPASYEEIQSLECAAVWEGSHILDRLSDHLAGRKNKWVKSMRPKLNG